MTVKASLFHASLEKKLFFAFVVLIIALASGLLFSPPKAAAYPNIPFENGSNYPVDVLWRLNQDYCARPNQTSAQTTWLSLSNNPGAESVTLDAGETLTLSLNVVTARCHPGVNTQIIWDHFFPLSGTYSIAGAPGVGIPRLTPPGNDIASEPPNAWTEKYSREAWSFNIDTSGIVFPAGPNSYVDIAVRAVTEQYSHRTVDPAWLCIEEAGDDGVQTAIWGPDFVSLCADAEVNHTFRVYRKTDPPAFDLSPSVSCVVNKTGSISFTVLNNGPATATGVTIDTWRRFGPTSASPTAVSHPNVTIDPGAAWQWTSQYTSPMSVGDRVWGRIRVTPGSSSLGAAGPAKENSSSLVDCGGEALSDNPYFKVYGGGVIAGSGFIDAGVCTLNPTARIRAFASQDESGVWRGASSQFASHASGVISGFYTAGLRDGAGVSGDAKPAIGLTFGNYSTAGIKVGNDLGGSDPSGAPRCMPDYYAAASTLPSATDAGITTVVRSLPVFNGGSTTLDTTGNPLGDDGWRYVIYHEGSDVTITGPGIQYAAATTVGWSAPQQMPFFYLVVKNGNIHISPSVSQLDGVYIAQNGTIDTCYNGSISDCSNKLTVNGSFIASNIKFNRTRGTVSDASPNEGPGSANIAEVFNFTPELYLAPVAAGSSLAPFVNKYDSIVGLPPIL